MKWFKIQRKLQKFLFALVPVKEWRHRLRRRFFFERRAEEIWRYFGATEEVCRLLARLERDSLWKDLPSAGLIFIASQLERGEKAKAAESLKKYTAVNGTDNLWKILPVAAFAHAKGFSTDLIRRAAILNGTFERNAKMFDALITGKSVSVVGNAPTEIGGGNGAKIDASDIVIRCNNFKTLGYERDYGRKCSVWVKSFESDINHDRPDIVPPPKLILYRSCPSHEILRSPELIAVMENDMRKAPISGMSLNDYSRARRCLSNLPTTGWLALDKVLSLHEKISGLRVFGFSFLKNLHGVSYGLHYAENRSVKTARTITHGHNFGEEGNILRQKMSRCEKVIIE